METTELANAVDIDDMLSSVRAAGLTLEVAPIGNKLILTGPQTDLSPDLIGRIQEHKVQLLRKLRQEAVQPLQALAASTDWRTGLRCGLSGQQCRVCKGVPCEGSSAWNGADHDHDHD